MKRLTVTLLLTLAAACTPAPPCPFECGPDMGPDPGTDEHAEACRLAPDQPSCVVPVK